MKCITHYYILFLALVINAFCVGCSKETDDHESIQSSIYAVTIHDETLDADVLIAHKNGAYIICDADTGSGYGLVYFNPDRDSNPEDGLYVFINTEGLPVAATYKGKQLLCKNISNGVADLLFIDTDGTVTYSFDMLIPEKETVATLQTKAFYDLWVHSWLDFIKTTVTFSWDDDQKKALVPYALKVASFMITGFSLLDGNPMDALNVITTLINEINKSWNGYEYKDNISFGEAYVGFGASAFWNIADGKPFAKNMGLGALATVLNEMADEMLDEIGKNNKVFDEALEFKDYYVKLSPGDEHSSLTGMQNRITLNCGPQSGRYIVNIDTKSDWEVDFDFDSFVTAGRITENGVDKIEVIVLSNDSPSDRVGFIEIKTPGRSAGADADKFNGLIIVNQSADDKYFTLSDYSLTFPAEGGAATVNVLSKNDDVDYWIVYGGQDWCQADKKGDNSFIVNVEEYTYERETTCYVYVIAYSKERIGQSYKIAVEIKQDAQAIIEEQTLRNKLIQFYNDTDGPNWIRDDNWCTDLPVNQWYGISLYDNHFFLRLNNNGLKGEGTLSDCTMIKSLECFDNQLTSLDLSGCTSLTNLLYRNNPLTSLDVSGCTSLASLECYNNHLTSLDVSGCTSLWALGCYGQMLSSLDASGCTSLKSLDCSGNRLTSLDVSRCTSLSGLGCGNNQLTSLDVSGCTSLEELECYNNQLTSLDVSGCTSLEELECYNNQLTSLDVSRCTSLSKLSCDNNQLTSLDVSRCTSLSKLSCDNNQLTSLDVSRCTSLSGLGCGNNQLTSLDVSRCTSLKWLVCFYNQLTSLDVSGFTSLEELECYNNQLASLDVSGCTALISLECYENQLTSLDVSGCASLDLLRCENNHIIQQIINEDRIRYFSYDRLYEYTNQPTYFTNPYGWYYPGEPEKGYHGR